MWGRGRPCRKFFVDPFQRFEHADKSTIAWAVVEGVTFPASALNAEVQSFTPSLRRNAVALLRTVGDRARRHDTNGNRYIPSHRVVGNSNLQLGRPHL